MALPMVDVETLCPNSSSKASRCSSRVRSSLASRCSGSHSRSIAPFLEGLPGMGSGSTSPISRRLFSQRFMVGIDTEKVFATSSLGLPASTAASTLNLRSFEYGFMPGGYHICGSILTGAAVRTQTQEQRATASKEIRVSKPILHRTTTRRNGCRRIVALEKVAGLSPVGHPLRSSKDEPDMWN